MKIKKLYILTLIIMFFFSSCMKKKVVDDINNNPEKAIAKTVNTQVKDYYNYFGTHTSDAFQLECRKIYFQNVENVFSNFTGDSNQRILDIENSYEDNKKLFERLEYLEPGSSLMKVFTKKGGEKVFKDVYSYIIINARFETLTRELVELLVIKYFKEIIKESFGESEGFISKDTIVDILYNMVKYNFSLEFELEKPSPLSLAIQVAGITNSLYHAGLATDVISDNMSVIFARKLVIEYFSLGDSNKQKEWLKTMENENGWINRIKDLVSLDTSLGRLWNRFSGQKGNVENIAMITLKLIREIEINARFNLGMTKDNKTMVYVEGNDKISNFYISRYEIGPFNFETTYSQVGPIPAQNLALIDMKKKCNELSRKNNLKPYYDIENNKVNSSANGFRIATREQWEHAASGGVYSLKTKYSGSNIKGSVDNWDYSVVKQGSFAPNELGIYDMSGNAIELTVGSEITFKETEIYKSSKIPSSGIMSFRAVVPAGASQSTNTFSLESHNRGIELVFNNPISDSDYANYSFFFNSKQMSSDELNLYINKKSIFVYPKIINFSGSNELVIKYKNEEIEKMTYSKDDFETDETISAEYNTSMNHLYQMKLLNSLKGANTNLTTFEAQTLLRRIAEKRLNRKLTEIEVIKYFGPSNNLPITRENLISLMYKIEWFIIKGNTDDLNLEAKDQMDFKDLDISSKKDDIVRAYKMGLIEENLIKNSNWKGIRVFPQENIKRYKAADFLIKMAKGEIKSLEEDQTVELGKIAEINLIPFTFKSTNIEISLKMQYFLLEDRLKNSYIVLSTSPKDANLNIKDSSSTIKTKLISVDSKNEFVILSYNGKKDTLLSYRGANNGFFREGRKVYVHIPKENYTLMNGKYLPGGVINEALTLPTSSKKGKFVLSKIDMAYKNNNNNNNISRSMTYNISPLDNLIPKVIYQDGGYRTNTPYMNYSFKIWKDTDEFIDVDKLSAVVKINGEIVYGFKLSDFVEITPGVYQVSGYMDISNSKYRLALSDNKETSFTVEREIYYDNILELASSEKFTYDKKAPSITLNMPASGTVANKNQTVKVTYNEPVKFSNINDTIYLMEQAKTGGSKLKLTGFTYDSSSNTFNYSKELKDNYNYEVIIYGISDELGNKANGTSIKFSTKDSVALNGGNGTFRIIDGNNNYISGAKVANMTDSTGKIISTSGKISESNGVYTIKDIPVGTNYSIQISAFTDSSGIKYKTSTTKSFSVKANESTNIGTITMLRDGEIIPVGATYEMKLLKEYKFDGVSSIMSSIDNPNQELTRWEAFDMIFRMLQYKWGRPLTVGEKSIITNQSNPSTLITRDEVITMLVRALENFGNNYIKGMLNEYSVPYGDMSSTNSDHIPNIKKAYSAGMLGYSSNFNPKGKVSRSVYAKWLVWSMEYVTLDKSEISVDTPYWDNINEKFIIKGNINTQGIDTDVYYVISLRLQGTTTWVDASPVYLGRFSNNGVEYISKEIPAIKKSTKPYEVRYKFIAKRVGKTDVTTNYSKEVLIGVKSEYLIGDQNFTDDESKKLVDIILNIVDMQNYNLVSKYVSSKEISIEVNNNKDTFGIRFIKKDSKLYVLYTFNGNDDGQDIHESVDTYVQLLKDMITPRVGNESFSLTELNRMEEAFNKLIKARNLTTATIYRSNNKFIVERIWGDYHRGEFIKKDGKLYVNDYQNNKFESWSSFESVESFAQMLERMAGSTSQSKSIKAKNININNSKMLRKNTKW